MNDQQPILDSDVPSEEGMPSQEWALILGAKHQWRWKLALGVSLLGVFLLVFSLVYMTSTGVGVLGVQQGVPWGWDIMNFVFWIGIAHAGTLISAILLLTRQVWRRSVSRVAELSTLCAVLCASLYPLFHIGRVWLAWFFVPVPESSGMWQNFLSPLMWDAFAVGSYACVSCLFFYVSLIPDLGEMRDAVADPKKKRVYEVLSFGWSGSVHQRVLYKRVCWLLALVLTPLVISVHSIVSYDFAVTLIPGWKVSVFPPYFVGGAILSGLAMVSLVVIALREFLGMKSWISSLDLSSMGKLMAAMGLVMGSFYLIETFFSPADEVGLSGRYTSAYVIGFLMMVICNVVLPQFLWKSRVRSSSFALGAISVAVLVGMWVERYLIVVSASERAFLPYSWSDYMPSWIDVIMFAGTFGLFVSILLMMMKVIPLVNLYEMKESDDDHLALPSIPVLSTQIQAENPPLESDELGFKWPHKGMGGWAFGGAFCGLCVGVILLYYTQVVDYPYILQGRVADSSRFLGFVPVLLEMTLLGAAISTVFAFINRMLK